MGLPPGFCVAQFNDHIFHRRESGLGRYGRELHRHLKDDCGVDAFSVATWSNLEGDLLEARCRETDGRVLPGGRRTWLAKWHFLRRPTLEREIGEFDLLHISAPGYVVPTKRPVVVTVHDVGLLTDAKHFSHSYPFLFRGHMRDIIKRDATIVCPSAYTAAEFRRLVSDDLDVHVVPHGTAAQFCVEPGEEDFRRVREKHSIDRPFFLSVGSVEPRKNLLRLIRAFGNNIDAIPHELLIVGTHAWDGDPVFDALRADEWKGRARFLGPVDDAELNILYRLADGFSFASLFEGFGLPALEAMQCGCAVISSNTTSLPEVVGDGGLLVDPTSVEEIGTALRRIAQDSTLREDLGARAQERAQRFSWRRTAERTLEIYESALTRPA